MLHLNVFVTGGELRAWYDAYMRHDFLYGAYSFGDILTVDDVAGLHQLGHNAHLRFVHGFPKRHELHQELQILHYLKQYGIQTVVDISNSKDVHRVSQHVRELADILITKEGQYNFVIEHDDPTADDSIRARRIVSSLRSIEASQAQGKNTQGYFCGSFHPEIRQSDIVFRAIIQQASRR